MNILKLRCLMLSTFLVLSGCYGDNVDDFKSFVTKLKNTDKEEQINNIRSLYSETTLRSVRLLHKTPDTPKEEILDEYTQHFSQRYLNNKDIIQFKDESFLSQEGLYLWNRKAEYKEYAGEFYDLTAEFVFKEGHFEVAPHFTHPTSDQLTKLEGMKNVYAIYYVMDNVRSYQWYVNDKKIEMINPNVNSSQLLDTQAGPNSIKFTFKKDDESKPVFFAATLVFIPRDKAKKDVAIDDVIHVSGEALAVDTWGDLAMTKEKMLEVTEDQVIISVDLK